MAAAIKSGSEVRGGASLVPRHFGGTHATIMIVSFPDYQQKRTRFASQSGDETNRKTRAVPVEFSVLEEPQDDRRREGVLKLVTSNERGMYRE